LRRTKTSAILSDGFFPAGAALNENITDIPLLARFSFLLCNTFSVMPGPIVRQRLS